MDCSEIDSGAIRSFDVNIHWGFVQQTSTVSLQNWLLTLMMQATNRKKLENTMRHEIVGYDSKGFASFVFTCVQVEHETQKVLDRIDGALKG